MIIHNVLDNLRHEDYNIVIIRIELLCGSFLFASLIFDDLSAVKKLGGGFRFASGAVSTQVGYKSSRSPLHRAAAIHFIHFNEAAVMNRSGAIITQL
jgi:hypothetical protein